jgi:hypothetical protein
MKHLPVATFSTLQSKKQAIWIVELARKNPYIALTPRTLHLISTIPMQEWETYFSEALNRTQSREAFSTDPNLVGNACEYIISQEVATATKKARNGNVVGPDKISYEYIKNPKKCYYNTGQFSLTSINTGQIPISMEALLNEDIEQMIRQCKMSE